jgi:uncharacterized membrane protein
MGQDPNQPYSNPYGQPPSGGVPPQGGEYYQGYPQQQQTPPPQGTYPPPPQGAYPPPNTGYQQPYGQPTPGYQQPYGQQSQYNTANPLGPTTINMEPNVAAGLSYLGTWVTGLIFILIEKQNRFVRFHAMQSILAFATLTVLSIVVSVITAALSFVSVIGCVLTPLVSLAWLAVWLICMINGFQGKYFKLPIIGDYAERWANGGTNTPGF